MATTGKLTLDPITSKRLGRVRQAGTRPELDVRALARTLGLRYRVRNRDLPGSPDLANRKYRWAILVHGCFWHAHDHCNKATLPKRNREFWIGKLSANKKRDSKALSALRRRGFKTLVIWECELRNPDRVRQRLQALLQYQDVGYESYMQTHLYPLRFVADTGGRLHSRRKKGSDYS